MINSFYISAFSIVRRSNFGKSALLLISKWVLSSKYNIYKNVCHLLSRRPKNIAFFNE